MKPEFLFHNTVAAVIEHEGKFLLVKEKASGRTVYNQPAGHLEGDESLTDAVIRETLEETGQHFTPEHLTGIYLCQKQGVRESYLRVTFCGTATPCDPPPAPDPQIIEAVWLSADEIERIPREEMRSEMVWLCIKDYLEGKRYPLDLLNYLHSQEPLADETLES